MDWRACFWRLACGAHGALDTRPPCPSGRPRRRGISAWKRTGSAWLVGFLDTVAEAARLGFSESQRLRRAEEKAQTLGGIVFQAVLRMSVTTVAALAKDLDITLQAAARLLQLLVEAGLAREATGRASWRAFVLA
jgi:hypothetical protein